MHEVGLAYDILDIATRFAEEHSCRKISCIELDVGECSGVMPQALEIGFESARKETIAKRARLDINLIPGKIQCCTCQKIRSAKEFTHPCPVCGQLESTVIEGKDFRLKSIDAR